MLILSVVVRKGVLSMNWLCSLLLLFQSSVNPATGDNSLTGLLVVGGIGAVALILLIVLLITSFLKKKK